MTKLSREQKLPPHSKPRRRDSPVPFHSKSGYWVSGGLWLPREATKIPQSS